MPLNHLMNAYTSKITKLKLALIVNDAMHSLLKSIQAQICVDFYWLLFIRMYQLFCNFQCEFNAHIIGSKTSMFAITTANGCHGLCCMCNYVLQLLVVVAKTVKSSMSTVGRVEYCLVETAAHSHKLLEHRFLSVLVAPVGVRRGFWK